MGSARRLPRVVVTPIDHAVEQFIADCQLRGLSATTLTHYRVTLGPFVRHAAAAGCTDLRSVTDSTLRDFMAEKRMRAGAKALNNIRDAVRRFYDWAILQGLADANPAARIAKVREPRKIILAFSEAEVQALLAQPDTRTFIGLRDHVFMLLLLDTGVRLAEATGLRLVDVDLDEGTLRVFGKAAKERLVGFSPLLAYHIRNYIARRALVLAEAGRPNCPWLFPNAYGEKPIGRTFQSQIKLYGARAGITRVRCSPHTFRHSFALWYVRNGGSPFHLQRILGHSDLAMSRRYCELADVDFLAQHRRLSPLTTLDFGSRGQPRLR